MINYGSVKITTVTSSCSAVFHTVLMSWFGSDIYSSFVPINNKFALMCKNCKTTIHHQYQSYIKFQQCFGKIVCSNNMLLPSLIRSRLNNK